MATRYVGIGGNDGNSGLTWALRKLTLNGVEDTPVVANDLIYVGPGVHREMLTVDVSGGAGTEIVYVGDVTGEHTDGVGGIVRITGSDNDQTTARNNVILASAKNYRIFRGFCLDFCAQQIIDTANSCTHWTVEDCCLQSNALFDQVYVIGDAQSDWNILRCLFLLTKSGNSYGIDFWSAAGIQDASHLVQNCLFITGQGRGIAVAEVGGVTVRNCTFCSGAYGLWCIAALPVGFTAIAIENCIFTGLATAVRAAVLGNVLEDYNTFFLNVTDRNQVAIGANSETYPALFQMPLLHAGASQVSGFQFPWWFSKLSEWSQVRAITGNNEPSVDLHGIPRPVTASKNSWGLMQFVDMELESGTVQAGTYSRVLHDAGQVLVRRIPVTGVEITVTLYMRFEADYEPDPASLPQMVIKQPGVADRTTVMTVAANNWEQLSDTFTPASPPGFIEVWAESLNTAAAGAYEVFYDSMGVA